MALDPNRWTHKTQEAISRAVEAAQAASNPEVTPDHLLLPSSARRRASCCPILQRVGRPALGGAQRGRGGPRQPAEGLRRRGRAWPASSRPPRRRPTPIRADLHDEYLSTEHLLLALADHLGVDREALLGAMQEVRGSHRVTLAEPRGAVPGPGEVRPGPHRGRPPGAHRSGHRSRRGDPPRDPGALAPHEEQPRAHRRARRRQDRHRRGPGPAHRRGRRPREPEAQAADQPRPRVDGGRRQVPRRVRGAAEGRAQGDHRRRR